MPVLAGPGQTQGVKCWDGFQGKAQGNPPGGTGQLGETPKYLPGVSMTRNIVLGDDQPLF